MHTLARLLDIDPAELADLQQDLIDRGETAAVAESLTGGLLAAVLTEIPGSSAVVRGGLVVYATDLKHQLADVDADLLAAVGPVDPRVAAALADGARRRCGADIGIGLTGVAGPDAQDGIGVGTWFCAVSGPGEHRDDRHGLPTAAVADPAVATGPVAIPDTVITESNRGATSDVTRRSQIRAAAVRGALEMLTNIAATHS